jgi:hypothetical protein
VELALLMMFGCLVIVWLVFFKFKWLRFSIAWGIVSSFIVLHVLLIFMIGLRFVTPYTTNARSSSTPSSSFRVSPSRRS